MPPPPPQGASARPPPRSAPSGIAQQLRKSADQQAQVQVQLQQEHQQHHADTMNLDDFIFPSSVGSPAGLSPELSNEDAAPFNATAPSIPIRKPNQVSDHNLSLARASAPSVPPTIHRENEFGYVPRHVRKTSIDERRVSLLSVPIFTLCRQANRLSATQTAGRSLATSPSREQHHDSHRCPSRGRPTPVLA
jgi:GATA-binding protein